MKNIRLIVAALALFIGISATAQDFSSDQYAKWGTTPEQRQQNLLYNNLLKESLDSKDYVSAVKYFTILSKEAPQATENIFIRGAQLYTNKTRIATPENKQAMLDSLMIVYDMRIQYYPNSTKFGKAYLLDRKAREYRLYNPSDIETQLVLLRDAVNAEESKGEDFLPETAVIYLNVLVDNYKVGKVTAEDIFNEYSRLTTIFTEGGDRPNIKEFQNMFDACFASSGVADCESLEKLFSAKIAADPSENNIYQAFTLMSSAKCDSPFYVQVAEQYYEIDPSAEKAIRLADIFQNRQDYAKATQYMRKALSVETDAVQKEKLLSRIGLVDLAANNIYGAADAAREARNLNPINGVAYFVLAQCYAISASGCQGISRSGAMWAAYDTMAKAAELFGNNPDNAPYLKSAQALMSDYRRHFPSAEECFFNELKEGSRYTVTCGIASGITTTVRTN